MATCVFMYTIYIPYAIRQNLYSKVRAISSEIKIYKQNN